MSGNASQKKGGCLRYGCFGCAGIFFFFVIVVVGLVGVATVGVRNEEVADLSSTPEIPFSAIAPPTAATGPVESPEGSPPPPADGTPPVQPVGRIVLDLKEAEFDIEPAGPGERMEIEAVYDTRSFSLEEHLTEHPDTAPGEPAWTYEVRFSSTGGWLTGLKQLLGGTKPRVKIKLPAGIPLVLEADLGQGGTRMELGGLWLTEGDLRFRQGGFDLRVSEPMAAPMEHLKLDGSMGGLMIRGLGNASPKALEVDFSMGGLSLDLRGAWTGDSDIEINQSMGGGLVQLPPDVIIEGLKDIRGNPDDPEGRPVLRFRTSSSMGDLEYR